MKLSSQISAIFVLIALLAADRAQGQSSECETVLNGLAGSPTCAQLQDTTQKYAPTVQNGDCAAVKSVLARFPTTTECCPALRRLVTSGCGCLVSFRGVVAALGGYKSADEAIPVIEGSAKLIQESVCAGEQFGGRIVNPCDGSLGVCASSRKLY